MRLRAKTQNLRSQIEDFGLSPTRGRHYCGRMPLSDHEKRLLDEMADAGCLWLLYSGGEIFARPDFLDIYRHAKRRGFIVTLFTNGILINERIADVLAEWRPFSIEITLYGRTRETYERLTGVPGSFDRCMRGIRLLRERGLPLTLKTVAVSINKHEVWDMQRFAEVELGVPFRFDAMMNPRIDCSLSPLAVRLSPEECVEFDVRDAARTTEWQTFAAKYQGPVHTPDTEGQLYHCGGGVDSFAINPYGEMTICTLSQVDRYDLRRGSFIDGWTHFLRQIRVGRRATRPTKCVSCELKAMCGMCPANGELEHGDAEATVDFLCEVAHLRAHVLGLPIPPHGPCEYCEGGTQFGGVRAAAERLRALDGGKPSGHGRRLTVINATAAPAGGCGTCGHH